MMASKALRFICCDHGVTLATKKAQNCVLSKFIHSDLEAKPVRQEMCDVVFSHMYGSVLQQV